MLKNFGKHNLNRETQGTLKFDKSFVIWKAIILKPQFFCFIIFYSFFYFLFSDEFDVNVNNECINNEYLWWLTQKNIGTKSQGYFQ